jgi:hypothetical protein
MTTNELTATKAEFALDLTTNGLLVEVSDFVPDRITPPIVMIRPGGTYVAPSSLRGEYTLALECDLIATPATNEVAQESLDALICDFISALPSYAVLTNIGAPFALTTGNAEFLASTATLNLSITL